MKERGTEPAGEREPMPLWQDFKKKDGLLSNLVYSATVDHEGRLWFGCKNPNGLTCYDGATWRRFTSETGGFGQGHVWDMAVDREGRLWVATAGGGAARFDGRNWRRYTMEDGLAGDHVYAVAVSRDGEVWLGCAPPPDAYIRQGGVSRFDGARFESLTSDYTQGRYVGGGNSGLCDNRVYSIVLDREGKAWFGTKGGGICRYDGRGWEVYNTSSGLPSDEVGDGAAHLDVKGNVWFGLRAGGACRFDGESWTIYDMQTGLAGNFVYAIETGPEGNLWFGCAPDPEKVSAEGGVSVFDGATFRNYTSDYTGGRYVGGGNSPLVDNRVYVIVFDRDGNGWFGTKGGGVSRLAREAIMQSGASV